MLGIILYLVLGVAGKKFPVPERKTLYQFSPYKINREGKMNKIENSITVMHTTPIVNILQHDFLLWEKYFSELLGFLVTLDEHRNLLELHNEKLGEHNTVFKVWNSYRFVWQWDNGCMLFVNNDWGISFEVPLDMKPAEAIKSWRNYRDIMTIS